MPWFAVSRGQVVVAIVQAGSIKAAEAMASNGGWNRIDELPKGDWTIPSVQEHLFPGQPMASVQNGDPGDSVAPVHEEAKKREFEPISMMCFLAAVVSFLLAVTGPYFVPGATTQGLMQCAIFFMLMAIFWRL